MKADTTQPSPSEKVAQFLVAQEIGMGIGRLVAWAQGKAMSHERVGWPSNLFPNRHMRRDLFSSIQRGGRREKHHLPRFFLRAALSRLRSCLSLGLLVRGK